MKVVSFLLFSTVLCAKDDLSISKGYYISGSDDNLEIICEPGHYCEEGVMYQCPAGMYNDIQGSTSIESCKICLEGYYCPAGSVRPTQNRCGDANLYCPPGTAQPLVVPKGYYSTNGGRQRPSEWPRPLETDRLLAENDMGDPTLDYIISKEGTGLFEKPSSLDLFLFTPRLETEINLTLRSIGTNVRTTLRKCVIGTYCINGFAYLCPPGVFGGESGLTSPICSGECESGFFCPLGSVSPFQHRCYNESYYCPKGVGIPISITTGHYSAGGRTSLNGGRLVSSTLPVICNANYTSFEETYGSGSGSSLLEPAGGRPEHPDSECVEPHENDGPGFSILMSGESSLTWEHDLERARYSLALSSNDPFESPREVSETDFFRNIDGSRSGVVFIDNNEFKRNGPRLLNAGSNSIQDDLTKFGLEYIDVISSTLTSDKGLKQMGGGEVPLEDRRAISDLIPSAESLSTAGGPILRTGVVDRQPCKVKRSPLFSAHSNASFSQWRYCFGSALGDADTRSLERICEAGTFCWRGLRFECPPGFYGSLTGETRYECSNECPSGYFCPWGSSKPLECGGTHLYCPQRSGAPTPVDIGHYSAEGEPDMKKTRQLLCEPGHYCVNGTRFKCPAGRFGARFGLLSSHCSGECSPGFFCPSGSSLPTQIQCGLRKGSSVFCPAGSIRPLPASTGSYTVGGFERVIGLSSNATRTAQVPCEPGHYCVEGVKRQCPEGTFGSDFSLSSESCSGLCAPGHFCPPGSVSKTEYRCGEIYLFLVDVLLAVPAQAAIQGNRYNNSDNVPLTDPTYDYKELYALYRQLSSSSSLSGVSETGAWRELTDTDALLKIFDPTGSGDDAAGGINNRIRSPNEGEALYYNASTGLLQFRTHVDIDGFPFDAEDGTFPDRYLFPSDNTAANLPSSSSSIRTGADSLYYYDIRVGSASRNGTINKPLPCGPLRNMSFVTSTKNAAESYKVGNSTGGQINATDYECSILKIGEGEAEHMLEPSQISSATDSLLRAGMDGSIILQLIRVGPVNFTTVAERRVFDLERQIQQEQNRSFDLLAQMLARGESEFELAKARRSSSSVIASLNATLASELRNLRAWGSLGVTAAGTDVLSKAGEANATVLNYTVTIPWRAGVRFRLPPMFIPLPSFSGTMRHLLQGGPSSVYCPAGTGWPKSVPSGWYSTSSELAKNASRDDDLAAISMGFPRDLHAHINSTRDSISLTEPGYYASAGIRHPCAPGFFGSTAGLVNRACSGYCPAGYECPSNTSQPIPCLDGTYATGGNDKCIPCPVPKAVEAPLYPLATSLPVQPTDPLAMSAPELAHMQGGVIPLSGVPTSPVKGSFTRCTTSRNCCGF
jgi:hypothetical protein